LIWPVRFPGRVIHLGLARPWCLTAFLAVAGRLSNARPDKGRTCRPLRNDGCRLLSTPFGTSLLHPSPKPVPSRIQETGARRLHLYQRVERAEPRLQVGLPRRHQPLRMVCHQLQRKVLDRCPTTDRSFTSTVIRSLTTMACMGPGKRLVSPSSNAGSFDGPPKTRLKNGFPGRGHGLPGMPSPT
jgi:hypothetical protein